MCIGRRCDRRGCGRGCRVGCRRGSCCRVRRRSASVGVGAGTLEPTGQAREFVVVGHGLPVIVDVVVGAGEEGGAVRVLRCPAARSVSGGAGAFGTGGWGSGRAGCRRAGPHIRGDRMLHLAGRGWAAGRVVDGGGGRLPLVRWTAYFAPAVQSREAPAGWPNHARDRDGASAGMCVVYSCCGRCPGRGYSAANGAFDASRR